MSDRAVPFSATVASVLLDAVRAIAAMLVCLYHARFLLFDDYSHVTTHRALWFVPYALCGFGHQAVLVFFILSGYLVGGHVLRAVQAGRWSWRVYLLHRLVRLWVVLLPALLLGALLDGIAFHWHLAPALYAGLVDNHLGFNTHAGFTLTAFAGNLLFVQKILTPVFGSNGALWSLAYEFWYYLIFPLGLLAVWGPYRAWSKALSAVLCVAACAFVGKEILLLLPVWMLGVLLALLPVRPIAASLRWLATAVFLGLFTVLSRGNPETLARRDYLLSVVTFFFLWMIVGAQEPARTQWYVRPSRLTAGFSYTLYLVHTPMLMLATALLVGESRWAPTFARAGILLALVAFVLALSYLLATLTEFRTAAIRLRAERALLS